MFWVFKVAVSMRRLLCTPKTYISINESENNHNFTYKMFAYSGPTKKIIVAIRLNMALFQNQSEPIFSYIFVCLFHLVNGHDRNEGVNSPFTIGRNQLSANHKQ